jgi:uncharacterized cupredoxin-like copper-binding protein
MQSSMCRSRRTALYLSSLILYLGISATASAAVTATPPAVSIFPTQTSGAITVTLSFQIVPTGPGSGTVTVTGLPAGVTTTPANVQYSYAAGQTSASTSFSFVASSAAVPGGPFAISLTDATLRSGTTTVMLTISSPSFTPIASPNPVTLTIGGAPQSVTVSTVPDPGFSPTLTYTFTGLPNFISFGAPQTVRSPYSPVTFPFSTTAGAAPGLYAGTLSGSYTDASGAPQTRTTPFTVTVQQADISVAFGQPVMPLCAGAPAASNSVTLVPVNGYGGTPTLSFTSVPAGITITPMNPVSLKLPQTISFTAAAAANVTGIQAVTLTVTDPTYGISKTATLTLNVTQPGFTPSVSPTNLSLTAGGGGQTFTASITPNACFGSSSVTVTPRAAQAGITFSPSTATITGPSATPVVFSVSAAASVPTNTYPITFDFTLGSATTTASATVAVSPAPDFALAVNPSTLTIAAGSSGITTVSATALNGFNGVINVVAPAILGVTFNPATFTLAPGASQVVTVTAQTTAPSGSSTSQFTATAAGISGSRSATFTANVVPAPDYGVVVSPTSLSIAPNSSGNASVSVTGLNGFTGMVSFTSGAPAGVTVTPAAFSVPAGGTQAILVSVGPGATPGPVTITFNGTASGAPSHSGTLFLTITPGPDFTLTIAPSSVQIAAGGSTTVSVGATGINGFSGSVTVTAPSVTGLSFTPATFTIAAGTTQPVTIAATAGTPPGSFSGTFSGSATGVTGVRTATVNVTVTQAPDYSLTVTPSILTIAAGQSATATVGVTSLNGFSGSVSVMSIPPAGIQVSPTTFTIAAGSTQTITISVTSAQPGALTIPLNATATGAPSHQSSISVNVIAAPDFTIAVSPAQLSLAPGQSSTFVLTATAAGGFNGAISVVAPQLSGVTFNPPVVVLQANASQSLTVTALPTAVPGTFPLVFTATASGNPTQHTAQATLVIVPPNPVITAVTPTAVAIGTPSTVVHLTGLHFSPGASVTTTALGILIDSVTITSESSADVVVTVTGKALPGVGTLKMNNPDGGSATGTLFIYPTSSLAAPLGVTAVAVVYPRPGTLIGQGQQVLVRGLLATTGTGAVNGFWKLDGVPFDTFTLPTAGGMPVEITAHVPIPFSYLGDHQLQLEVQNPKQMLSAAVPLVFIDRSESELRIIAPPDGAVLRGGQELRWSIMPGAVGYRVEVEGSPTRLPLRINVAESQLALSDPAGEWGTGIHRWRVRAMFAANVEGPPTEWRRVALLPTSARLLFLPATHDAKSGRTIIHWSGGAPGALYRIELIDPASGKAIFSALTARQEYGLPSLDSSKLRGELLIHVTAYGPDGEPFGATGERPLSSIIGSLHLGLRYAQAVAVPAISFKQPKENETIRTDRPHIEAKWSTPVPADQVSLVIDTTDVTGVASVTPVSVAYDALLPLGPGAHVIHLSAGGAVASWNITVEQGSAAAVGPSAPAAATPALSAPAVETTATKPASKSLLTKTDWVFTPGGMITAVSGDGVQSANGLHAQFSSQADLASTAASTKLNGDIALRHDLQDPNKTVQESRNWIIRPGLQQEKTKEEVIVGYAPPDFLNQAELVTVGLTRGAVEGKQTTPYGTASYYETMDTRPVGVVAGNMGQQQKIRALAYETPANAKYSLRLVDLSVREDKGLYSNGGKGEVFGLFGTWALSPALNVIAEAARGKFDPTAGFDERSQKGNAFRLGLSGARGTMTWGMGLRRTESQFVNPANRGFTPGGIPDRTGFDMQLGKAFARTTLSGQMRYLRDSTASGSIVPQTHQVNTNLSLTQVLTPKMMLVAAGTWTHDQGDSTSVLPRTDRVQRGVNLTLTEALGRIGLSQVITRQELRDRVSTQMRQTISTGMLTVNGAVNPFFALSTFLSGTRSEGAPGLGTTDQAMLTLQPSIMAPRFGLTLQPRASWIGVRTSLSGVTTKTEQYQAIASWAPVWAGSLVSLQVSNDWNRNRITNVPSTGLTHTVAGSLNFHYGTGRGALMPTPAVQTPVAPPH